jgi:hypothetical protein
LARIPIRIPNRNYDDICVTEIFEEQLNFNVLELFSSEFFSGQQMPSEFFKNSKWGFGWKSSWLCLQMISDIKNSYILLFSIASEFPMNKH